MTDLKLKIQVAVRQQLTSPNNSVNGGGYFNPQQVETLSAAIAEAIKAYDAFKKDGN